MGLLSGWVKDWRAAFAVAILAISLVVAMICVIVGIDFGEHWDENRLTDSVMSSIRTGLLLPGWYNYPSASYDLLMMLVLPDIIVHSPGAVLEQLQLPESAPEGMPALAEAIRNSDFLLRGRVLFGLITVSTAVWCFAIARLLGRPVLEAALAAALLLGSWELGYHARWVAPDGPLMFAGAMAMFLMIGALVWEKRKLLWLHAAAAAVGLAIGSKYPGGILVLPLMFTAFTLVRRRDAEASLAAVIGRTALLGLSCGAVAVVAFVVTTPAAVLSPWSFVEDVFREIWHYARAGHHGNSIQPGLQHGGAILEYLALEVFSPWEGIAVLLAGAAVAGAVAYARADRALAIVLLMMPVVYLVYFSTQKVMFVRNLMFVFPVLAILSARGVSWGLSAIRQEGVRMAAAGVVALAVGANFAWQLGAAATVHPRDEAAFAAETAAYLNAHGGEKFLLLDGIGETLGGERPANVVTDAAQAQAVIIRKLSHPDNATWTNANRRGTYRHVAGPAVVNWDYYPVLMQSEHYLAVSVEQARSMGLLPVAG